MLRTVKNDRLTSDHTAPFTNARSQKAVHEIQFTNASSQKASPQKERKGELSPEGQKRYFMTISAKSCNRDCRITEIKELTSLFETSTRRAESTINVHSSRKRQENRQERQETAKTGPDALRLKAGSRSRPCVVRAPDGVLERICARPRRLSHFATAERGLPSTPPQVSNEPCATGIQTDSASSARATRRPSSMSTRLSRIIPPTKKTTSDRMLKRLPPASWLTTAKTSGPTMLPNLPLML